MLRPTTATSSNGHPFVLIVEDDPTFASILLELAHRAGPEGRHFLGRLGHGRDGPQDAAERDHARPRPVRHRRLRAARPAAPRPRHRRTFRSTSFPGAEQAAHALTHRCGRGHRKAGRPRAAQRAVRSRSRNRRAMPARRASAPRRRAPAKAKREAIPELAGSRILIIDDDIRNIYSLTSVLEAHGVEVLHAERGAEGIAILEADAGHRCRAGRHHDARHGRL